MVDTLTVYEMLLYTAELKRPLSEPLSSKKEAVDVLIGRLALEKCRSAEAGGEGGRGGREGE